MPLPTSAAGAAASGLGVAAQGFSYLINNANFPGGVQAALNLLDTYGNTKVIANPHIAALDNQKATIKAGNRIPINQQTIVGNTTNAVTTTSQYIDTGVLLQVTPHINAGGLVTLDVQAEVSSPGTPAAAGDAPPIDTRSVQTLLSRAVRARRWSWAGSSRRRRATRPTGLPLLDRIPILGGLFGSQTLHEQPHRARAVHHAARRSTDSVDIDARRSTTCGARWKRSTACFPATPNWPASPPSFGDRFNESINPYRWELPRPAVPNADRAAGGAADADPLPRTAPAQVSASDARRRSLATAQLRAAIERPRDGVAKSE